MHKNTEAAKPQIKDMPLEDAKAFIDAGWKTLPFIDNSREFGFSEAAKGVYAGLLQVAQYHPALHEEFGVQAMAFIADRPHWAETILFDLHRLARREPKIAPAVIDATLEYLFTIRGLQNGGLAYEDNRTCWGLGKQLVETAHQTGTTKHLLEKGLSALPTTAKNTHFILATALFDATRGDQQAMARIVMGVRDAMPAITEHSIYNGRDMIALVVASIKSQPGLLAELLEEASIALKAIARSHSGEEQTRICIENMLTLAKDDPRLRRQIVRLGQEVIEAGLEKSRTSEHLFDVLYHAGKDDPQLLPGLIETAWQTVLPHYRGGTRSGVVQELIDIGRNNPDARDAHKENARTAVFNIVTGVTWDTWRIGAPLKILRDALDIQDDRRILGDAFAMMKTGRGGTVRETWFIPKDAATIVIQGNKVCNINDVAKKGFENADLIAQVGRAASAVFFDEMTPDEGRRRIRRETGLRFETLR